MLQQYLVNVEKKDIRVAVLEDGSLVQLFIEPTEERAILGNIYKAVVCDIKPGIHAVFVDIGLDRNAFLHFDDIQAETVRFSIGQSVRRQAEAPAERHGRGRGHDRRKPDRPRFDPATALQPGDSLLVQVTKEGIGQKGPRVSTHISLPGRYLVLLPFADQEGGVSRKIEDVRERRRLRKILREILAPDKAYIVRTAGVERPAEEIKSDVGFLDRTWRAIRHKYKTAPPKSLLHNDHDILFRVVRDVVSPTANEIWIDSRHEFRQFQRWVRQMIPTVADRVLYYSDPLKNVFDRFEVEKQIQKAIRRKVWLRSGGYLIFDEMEAMTAIDVNTGKYTGGHDQDKTIYRTNLEASRTIAHQLRLRDIGGLIVIDFIDMENKQHQKNLMAEFKRLLHEDKAKTAVLNISEFGLVEMTRKRVRHSLKGFFFTDCPICGGSGEILTREQIWRSIRRDMVTRLAVAPRPCMEVRLHPEEKAYIEAEHSDYLRKWQARYRIEIRLLADGSFQPEQYQIREFKRPSNRRQRGSEPRGQRSETEKHETRNPKSEAQSAEVEPRNPNPEA
jgi:ribonuclease G